MNHITSEQMEELREKLEQKRSDLLEYRNSIDEADPVHDPERTLGNEPGEDALEDYNIIASEILGETTEDMIAEIDAALARMDDGTYGVDEETGEPIPYARLKLYPAARTGVRKEE